MPDCAGLSTAPDLMPQKRLYFAADEKLLAALSDPLRRGGFVIDTFENQAALLEAVAAETPDVVLLGYRLSDGTALGAFRALGEAAPPTMVILNPGQQAFRAGLLKAGVSEVAVAPVRPRAVAGRLIELAGGRRRNELRERTDVPVEIEAAGRLLRGRLLDVSREGLGVSVDGDVPEDIALPVLVKPPSGATLKLFGRLVHARTDGETVLAGLRLVGTTEDEESVLLQIAKAYPSSDVPLIIEKRIPKSEAQVEALAQEAASLALPVNPPVFAIVATPAEARVEWPSGVPSLLQSLEHLRFGAQYAAAKEAGFQDALPPVQGEFEEAALRFSQGLSTLERQAFSPDPDVLILEDDAPVGESPAATGLAPSFATMLCVGAARRFRALLVEKRGRAIVGQASVRRGLVPISLQGPVANEVLIGLRDWAVEAQGYLHDAQLARDRERIRLLQSLQEVAAKQALALSEVLDAARALADSSAERGAEGAFSRVS